jgi:hydroxyacylglutathione hydrolase
VFFRQVLQDDLACASYVVADGGEAAVIDPKWEIEDYIDLAEEHGFRIAHILETHNHADHVSGHGRLAAATGAAICISDAAGVEYEHRPLADGDEIAVGDVTIVALATPGHRPEHMAYLVKDGNRGDAPWLVVTGDSLFVGDLARPDLAVDPDEGARGLYRSVRRLLELDDFAEVWPAHIGGSLCGGSGMSEKPGSTIGFERRYNRLATVAGEDEFVRSLTASLAPQPPNFRRIVELNRGPLVTDACALDPLAPARVKQLTEGGAELVDGRDAREFDAGHVPRSINVPMTKAGVGTRAAWVLDLETDVVVTAGSDAEARRLGRLLEAVGFQRVRGYLAGGVPAWSDAALGIETTAALDVAGLAERLKSGDIVLLDVREVDEWNEGHVSGSVHVPYHDLRDEVPAELRDGGKPVAVACSAGNRSAIAASLLRRAGVEDVVHVADGGIDDLANEGIELERTRGASGR